MEGEGLCAICAVSISQSSRPLPLELPMNRPHSGIHNGSDGLPQGCSPPLLLPPSTARSQKPSASASGQASPSVWSLVTISTRPGPSPSSVASSILGRTFCAWRARSSTGESATRRERYLPSTSVRGMNWGVEGAAWEAWGLHDCTEVSQCTTQGPVTLSEPPPFSRPQFLSLSLSPSLSRLNRSELTRSGQSSGCWLAPPRQISIPSSKVRLGEQF